ncbi:MAG: protein-L-isoaspartate O-methyltransferase [Anaerolineae bacterium]|jgi:protein-L-isoaspartate(D-aspartate) O-methyltransferase|nr:protein-L-isoaspartate O-methyltransferase [Anaerolineae bacterium]
MDHNRLADALQTLFPDAAHEAAFRAIPRHPFLPEVPWDEVYSDTAIPTHYDSEGQVISSSSQPSMMLIMLRQLGLRPGHRVLEIGAGTGYNAAIMQHIVGPSGSVTTIEYDEMIAQQARDHLAAVGLPQVTVITGDGALGYAPHAPYDRILATVGLWDLPAVWHDQLRSDGVIVLPIALNGMQVSAAFRPTPDGSLYSSDNRPCGFVLMRGEAAAPVFHKRVNSASMFLAGDGLDMIDTAALHLLLSADQDQCHLSYTLSDDEFWRGFMPYIMLHEPTGYTFALFRVLKDQQAYGVQGAGFGLFTPGSACLIPYDEKGMTHCFAGADAFLAVEKLLADWVSVGRPTIDRLRLALYPKTDETPARGQRYPRHDHLLHAWLDEIQSE